MGSGRKELGGNQKQDSDSLRPTIKASLETTLSTVEQTHGESFLLAAWTAPAGEEMTPLAQKAS